MELAKKEDTEKSTSPLQKLQNSLPPWVSKYKLPLLIIGLVIIVLVLASIIFQALNDPRDTVKEFVTSIQTGDIDKMKSLLEPDDNKMEVTDKQLANIVKYAHQHNDYFQATQSDLYFQIELQEGPDYDVEELASMDGPTVGEMANQSDFYLKAKDYFFFKTYSIGMKPYYLHLQTNEAGASLKVEGKEVFKTTENRKEFTFGPLMPGVYQTSVEKKYPYANLTETNEVEMIGNPEHQGVSSLRLSGETVTIQSYFNDTLVYINGKPLGKQVKDLDNYNQYTRSGEFGPVVFNGTIKIWGERQFPWGKSQSFEQALDNNATSIDITPNPFITKEQQKVVQDVINTFAKQYIKAHVTGNPNVLTVADDSFRSGISNYIHTAISVGSTFKGKALGTRIDLDHANLSFENGLYRVKIPVEFHQTFIELNKYSTNTTPEEKYDKQEVTLTYNEKTKTWIVTDSESGYFTDDVFNGKNTVKSVFK
ncbi:TcaA 3rd/4th domain-containing protein [Laceyella tengchongensis]|jgi:uncharacterized membrane protein YvbJ|uniref:TcaA 3rd/4th domain-containing protein n=1 Tax=Laceyella tengchongensis TaxID=574699 RepID=UPI003A521AA9